MTIWKRFEALTLSLKLILLLNLVLLVPAFASVPQLFRDGGVLWGSLNAILGIGSVLVLIYGMLARKRWTWQLGIAQNTLALAGIGYIVLHWESLKQKAIQMAAVSQGELDPQTQQLMNEVLGSVWAVTLGLIAVICVLQMIGFWKNRKFLAERS